MLLSLVVPTYNERQNIKALVRRATAVLAQQTDSFEIIIVDDDSPDGTWQVAEELGRTNCHVKVIRRIGKRGLASAVVAGWAASSGEILGCMDGDLQHPPEMIETFVEDLRPRMGEGLSGWVAANRHTIVNSPPDLDLGDAAQHIGLRSAVSTIVHALVA